MVYLKTCLTIGLYLLMFAEFDLAKIQKGKTSINMLNIKEDKQSYSISKLIEDYRSALVGEH